MAASFTTDQSFGSYDLAVLYNHAHFVLGLMLTVEYINFGNSVEEIARIRDSSHRWCKSYFGTANFARNDLPVVLKDHPNMFNLAISSRSRLDLPPPPAHDDGTTKADTDKPIDFPFYSEPAFFDDATLDNMADEVAAWQHNSLQFHDEKSRAVCASQPVYATALKNTSIILNLPDVMASLARLNMAALEAGSQVPTFVDQIDQRAASRSNVTRPNVTRRRVDSAMSRSSSFKSTRSSVRTYSGMVVDGGSGSLDTPPEAQSLLDDVMDTDVATGHMSFEMDMDVEMDDAMGLSQGDGDGDGDGDAEQNWSTVWHLSGRRPGWQS